jgi:hypothetical protein
MGNKQLKIWEQPQDLLYHVDFDFINSSLNARHQIYKFVFSLDGEQKSIVQKTRKFSLLSLFLPKVLCELILSYFWAANEKILFCKYLINPWTSWERFQNVETKYSQRIPEKQDFEISFEIFDSSFTRNEQIILCWIFGFKSGQSHILIEHRKAIQKLWKVLHGNSRKEKKKEELQRGLYVSTYVLRQQLDLFPDEPAVVFRNKTTDDANEKVFERLLEDQKTTEPNAQNPLILDNHFYYAKTFRYEIVRRLPLRYVFGREIEFSCNENEIEFRMSLPRFHFHML